VVEELELLKGASQLEGARGCAPVGKAGIATAVIAIGRLLLKHAEIVEIDVNPLVASGEGAKP
jgi:hypothetical protein